MFAEFSENVIRNHLNLLKRSKGLYCKYIIPVCIQILSKFPFFEVDSGDEEDEENDRQENNIAIDLTAEVSSSAGQVTNIHHNYPVLCNMFKDPDNQFEKVAMAVLLPSGAQNVRVELSQDGMTALVKYGWPKTMYTMEDLFKKHLANKQTTVCDPKVTCFKDALENVRERVDACPQSMIKVNLPIKVQTAVDSWMKGGIVRDDGTHVAYAEFKGHIKEYNTMSRN